MKFLATFLAGALAALAVTLLPPDDCNYGDVELGGKKMVEWVLSPDFPIENGKVYELSIQIEGQDAPWIQAERVKEDC